MPEASVRIGDAAAAEKTRQPDPIEFPNSLLHPEGHIPCLVDDEAGVVRDLPGMAVGVGDIAAKAAMSGRVGGAEQRAAGGDEPRLLVFNPHPFAVTQSLRLPYLPPMAGAPDPKRGFGLEDLVPSGPSSHRIQRQDVVMSDLAEDRSYWTVPVAVPAFSYVTIPAADVMPAATTGVSAKDGVLSNGRVTLQLDPGRGGVVSLKLDGIEYAGAPAENLRFGVPVLERVASGVRTDMFDQVALEEPDWHKAWHTDWVAQRDMPARVA
eukprot:gene31146-41496_t